MTSEPNRFTTPVLASIISAGLAGVIAYNWQSHSFDQSVDSREFLQGEYIKAQEKLAEALVASAAASERVATHIETSTEVQRDMAVQIDDMGDETRQLNRWVETMLKGLWDRPFSDMHPPGEFRDGVMEPVEPLPNGGPE